ncbi:MAG: hypothetical protein JXA82_03820 [Sedimentisphaerales bacterium]|nr:hypothetical protein [Sedimentisphaerales bacterium]
MPGTCLACNLRESLGSVKDSFKQALHASAVEEYSDQILLESDQYILGQAAYAGYPVHSVNLGSYQLVLEGRIYNKTETVLHEELIGLADDLFGDGHHAEQKLADWLLTADGEFVVYLIHKPTRQMILFNDIFSRLPWYYSRQGDLILVGRNLEYMTAMLGEFHFDRMAIAQYLLCLCGLGPRTLIEGVDRLGPASLLRIDLSEGTISSKTIYEWNFEEKEHKDKSLEENAAQTARLFSKGCRNRVEQEKSLVLSLSGGLDSRLIAAALSHEKIPFQTVTWQDHRGKTSLDMEVAEQVAKTLGIPWNPYRLKPTIGKYVLSLLHRKPGQVPLITARSLQHYENIQQIVGSDFLLFTGLAGDRITCDLRPGWSVTTLDEAIDYILQKERGQLGRGDFDIETIASITGLSVDAIRGELKARLESYPEKDPAQKVVHYVIYEQTFKRYFEADDRPRSQFWAMSPFWSTAFFHYIYNCPDEQKAGWKLYHAVLGQLAPALCDIPRVMNWRKKGIPILTEPSLSIRIGQAAWNTIRTALRPAKIVYKSIKRTLVPPPIPVTPPAFEHPAELLQCMTEQITSCKRIGQIMSTETIRKILTDPGKHNLGAMGLLFTVISGIEYLSEHHSTIEKYQDANLDTYG